MVSWAWRRSAARKESRSMPRSYVPNPKHKWPKGFGSLCPLMPPEVSQQLLERAVVVAGVGANKLWMASGGWCFCAHRSPNGGDDAWHGFPVIGGDVDERVLDRLEACGIISDIERRRLRRQRSLPDSWE